MNADEKFEKLSQEMLERFLEKNPGFATFLGLHDPYDLHLPKGTTHAIEENIHLMEEWCKRLNRDFKQEELSEKNRIDWDILEKAYERFKFSFYERKTHELNPDAFGEIGGLFFIMFTRDYAPLEKRVNAIATRLEKTPQFLKEFRTRFDSSKPVKLWTEMAIEAAQNIGGLFHFILQATKGKISDETYNRLSKAIENIQPIFKTHMEWLHGLQANTTEEWALGIEKYEKLLQLRELGMTSEEIHKLGKKYLEELKAKRAKLAQQIAPGKSPEEVLKQIESNAPKTFEEALDFTKKTMEDARKFVQDNDIAKTYAEDVLLVAETPTFLRPIIPFAALVVPAMFDKPQIGEYIVTRPKDLSNLGKHLNYASIKLTAVHEAFPGHFLQTTISNRGGFVRRLAQGTETIEGWAHYCEEMMTDTGFITGLESRFMQINEMIWRAVRIIVDVKLSRGEMPFEEAVKMLEKETGMSHEGALAEVKRYTQSPGQPLSYLLGKHLILQLKEEIKKKMSGKFSDRMFHDTITENGYLPISMLREVFNQKINK